MKLAVTYDCNTGEIFGHFGKTPSFKVYELVNGEIVDSEVIPAEGQGHEALSATLKQTGAAALICGGIGTGAVKALADARISVFRGCEGDADENVRNFLSGNFVYQRDLEEHEHQEEGCGCGHHHDHGEECCCGEEGCCCEN